MSGLQRTEKQFITLPSPFLLYRRVEVLGFQAEGGPGEVVLEEEEEQEEEVA